MANLQDRMALARQHYESAFGKKLKNTEMAEYCKVSKASIGQWFHATKQMWSVKNNFAKDTAARGAGLLRN